MKMCCGRGFATDEAFDAHGTSVHPGCTALALRGETVEKAARNVMWDIADLVRERVLTQARTLALADAADDNTGVPAVDVKAKTNPVTNPGADQDPSLLPYPCPFCGRRFEEKLAETLHEDLVHQEALRAQEHPSGELQTKNSADASAKVEWVELADTVGAASAGPADVDDCPIAGCVFTGLPSAMVTHLGSPAHDQVDAALVDHYKRKKQATEQADKPDSFSDIQSAVQEAISDLFMDPISERCPYVWIADIALDWVVFEVRGDYYKITYSMDENGKVTLAGPPVSVQRRTIYVPVPDDDDDIPAVAV